MDAIDRLLAQVKSEYTPQAQTEAESTSQPPAQSQPQLSGPDSTSSASPQPWLPSVDATEDPLLAQLKAEYAQKDRLQALEQQQQQAEQLRKQQQIEQQQREVLAQKAQAWIESLVPLSDEGMWFEQFAENYPSKLEAAIDYLQALSANP